MTRGEPAGPDFGPYRVHELLGRGGMGVVHRAHDTVHRRTIALKRLPDQDVDDEFRARFRRECRIAAGLHHPHVVPVNAFGELDGQLYLDMMLVEGTDLRRGIGTGGIEPERAVAVLGQVARALDAAHARGLLHRDVKPSNILLDRAGHAYLADFGIACLTSPDATALTGSGTLLGSWDYMAPERLSGGSVDGRADQYSLACVLFECLTGRLPHPAEDPAAAVAGHLLHPAPDPSVFDPRITPALDEVVRRGLAKDPARRFPTSTELVAAAEAALFAGRTVQAAGATAAAPAPGPDQGRLIRAILRSTAVGRPPPAGGARACPYPGLRSFERDDAAWFHGRDHVVTDLLVRLAEQLTGGEPVVLVGASGSGKSSVLRAGLLPALAGAVSEEGAVFEEGAGSKETDSWPQVLCTPGADPIGTLAAGLGPLLGRSPGELADAIRAAPAELGAGCARAVAGGAPRPVIVVDQFEELFTHDLPAADRLAFATALAGARPALVLLAVRADLVQRCIELPALMPALTAPVLLGPMDATGLQEAIVAPARGAGIEVESGLPERLIADLGVRGDTGYDPGALPRLAHALRETWNQGNGAELTLEAYRRAGGIAGAVARTAEQVYAALDEPGRRVARTVLLRLVRVPENGPVTRRRVDPAGLAALDAGSGVLDRLIAARLVTVDGSGAQLAHEALLTAWPRLREWVELDRAGLVQNLRFTEAAQVWTGSGRQPDDLYRGARLAAVNAWRETAVDPAPLPTAEQEFLDHSNAADRAGVVYERRRGRRLRVLVAALSVLLLVASGAVVVATQLRGDALDARQRSLSRQLAASSALAADIDPRRAALLALGAWQAASTVEARSELLATAADPYRGVMATTHTGAVTGLAISEDAHVAATGGRDGTLRLWDVPGRRELARLGEVVGGWYTDVSMTADGRLLTSVEQKQSRATLWSVADRRPLFTLPEPAVVAAIAPDGRTFAAVLSETGQAVVHDTVTFRELLRFPVANSLRMTYSPDGALIATTDGFDIDLIRASDGARMATLAGHTGNVNAVDFDPTGSRLVSSSNDDDTLRVWDVRTGTQTRVVTSPSPYDAVFLHGDRLLSGGSGLGVSSFDPVSGTATGQSIGPGQAIYRIAVGAGGHTVLGGGIDGLVTVWTPSSRSLNLGDLGMLAVAPQPGGPLLAAVAGDGSGWLWDRATQDVPRRLAGHPGRLRDAQFSPDGSRLVTVGDDGTLLLWDPVSAAPAGRLSRPGMALTDVTFSPDGTSIAVAGRQDVENGEVLVLSSGDLAVRQRRPTATEPRNRQYNGEVDNAATSVTFSPDGRLLAASLTAGRVVLWNLADPAAPTRRLDGHDEMALAVAFTPDGTMLATSGSDRFVRLWDVADGRQVGALEGVSGTVREIAFSPDGSTLATASRDSVVRLWDVPGRQPLALIDRHSDELNGVAFDEHGELISAGADGLARVWDLDPEHATRELCRVLDPATIVEQWRQLGPDVGDPPSCPS